MEVTREEMLEFAKQATFQLDDRLCPYDRETLRAEAWLMGYEFAKRHQPEYEESPEQEEKPDEEYEAPTGEAWHNVIDEQPGDGEKVRIRILTNYRVLYQVATFKKNEATDEYAFFWTYGFVKACANVMWRRLKESEKED